MRGFYEQFFEVYDSITKLYFLKSVGDDFHSKKIIYDFYHIDDNVFINHYDSKFDIDFFIYKIDIRFRIDNEQCIIKPNYLFYIYNFINYAKLDINNIKDAYDKYIANEVCNELKSS